METSVDLSTTPSQKKPPRLNRTLRSNLETLLVPVLAVFSALVMGGLIIVVTDAAVYAAWRQDGMGAGLSEALDSVITAYGALFSGSLGNAGAISESLVASTPYILTGLAVAVGFRGGLFNIGGEGQLLVAAGASVMVGYSFQLPALLHLPLALLAGMVAGGLYGAIPGYLKARTGAHEVINTIMMNYIALNTISFLLNGPMKDRDPNNVIARTPLIAESARMPAIFEGFRIHWGFVLALIVAFIVWWLLNKTTLGFEIRTVGANPDAAKYAGINVKRTIIITMTLSGLLAGMAGALEVTGLNFRHELGFSIGYGFDAIAIALLGKSHPLGVVLAAILFAAMRNGATRMQFLTQLPVDLISVLQALILLFVAADDIIRYIYRIKAKGERVVLTRGWGG
jgi:simple sugar transport system permease protein